MAELARGSIADRPWGRTFATLGLRGVTGQLAVHADSKRFLVAFERGAVVAAASPLASDAAVRVALTSHLVSSSQVPEISRRQAAAPERDEVELIAELARLGPDHALRLRRRVIAQRASRTFSINHGEFAVTDRCELDVLAGCELDVRAVVYLGARNNLSEQRLSAELGQLGAWFQLKAGLDDDLPQFGFSDVEQPVVERLRDGGTLAEIEGFATTFVDGRTVRAVIYALASCNACDLEPAPGQPRAKIQSRPLPAQAVAVSPSQPLPRLTESSHPTESTQPMPPVPESTQPMMTFTGPSAALGGGAGAGPGAGAGDEPTGPNVTQPLTRTAVRPEDRTHRGTPGSGGMRAIPPARPAVMPLGQGGRPTPPGSEPVSVPKTTTRISTVPPPPRAPVRPPSSPPPPLASGSDVMVPPLDADAFDAPTWGDEAGDLGARGGRTRRPTEEATGWDAPGGSPRAPTRDSVGRERRDGRDSSSGSLRLPPDDPPRRSGSSGSIRIPDEAIRDALGGPRRERSSGSIRVPDEAAHEALRESSAAREREAARKPSDDARRRPSSSPGLRRPIDPGGESGPGLVVRPVVSTRPPPTRQIARVDTPQSHSVKALIAQRLKLLDQGADHFQLLGVGPDVAGEALRKAYFALARQLHPDRLAALGISDDGRHAQRLFAQINAGFAILSDHARRTRYVDVLRRGGEAAVRAEQARAEEMTRRILDAEEAFRRGELALRRDQPQAAVGELERAVQLNPDEADYHAALAWSRFCAAPDRAAAAAPTRAALDRAIQRAPKSVAPRFYLGRVERMLGRDQDALRHFRDVLTAVPSHAEAASEVRALEARLGGPKRR